MPFPENARGFYVEFTDRFVLFCIDDAGLSDGMGLEIEDGEDTTVGEVDYGVVGGGRERIDETLDLEVMRGMCAGFEGLGWTD
jgi:hypothetical protein